VLAQFGVQASMSGKGDCYDNAAMQSFFSSLKGEWTDWHTYQTRQEAQLSIFEYLEVFYNRQRRHSTLGYLSPATSEQQNNG
jgi:transposase InsO family protein